MKYLRSEENAGKGGAVRVLLWVSLLRERGKGKAEQGRNETMKVKRTSFLPKKFISYFFGGKFLSCCQILLLKKNYRLKSLV